jgi:hypothetical protein
MCTRSGQGCTLSNQRLSVFPAVALIAALAGCDSRKESRPPPPTVGQSVISFSDALPLVDGSARILGRPLLLSTRPSGEIVIGDRSDKDIKIYSPAGSRLRSIGRPGEGPGEFLSLMGAQSYGDSLAAYDFLLRRLTIFSEQGEAVRALTINPPAFAMRVVDDSLFLLISHPGQGGNLLRLVRRDGSPVSKFFDVRHTFREPKLRQLTAVFADGAGGRIFAGVFGSDSIHVFDYHGRHLASGLIPASMQMESLPSAYARARGQEKLPDGRWFHDGINALMSLVALQDGRAALLVAPYDTRSGTDLLDGGELIVLAHRRNQTIGVARQHIQAGLLGRDRTGSALFLRYRDAEATGIDLVRARVQ